MDIGIFEFGLVLIVGLIVIGPDRMPEVARKMLYWWTKIKDGINNTRTEIEREIGADDIRRQLRNEKIMKELGETKQAIDATVKETTENIQRFKHIGEARSRHITQTIHDAKDTVKDALDSTTKDNEAEPVQSKAEPDSKPSTENR